MPIQTTLGKKTLYGHQQVAVEWMMERELDPLNPGGLLCDEMGLGKTLSILGLLRNKTVPKTLVLCPLSLVQQLRKAAREAEFGVWTLSDTSSSKGEKRWESWALRKDAPQVYVTNYDKVVARTKFFKQTPFDRIICDEAHVLRNKNTVKAKTIGKIRAQYRWFLTGTPVVNAIDDLISIMTLLHVTHRPSMADKGKPKEWMERCALGRTQEQLQEALGDVLPGDPTIEIHSLPFISDAEAVFYRGVQGCLVEQLQALMERERMDMAMFLTLILRLRQISVHPQVYIGAKKRADPTYRRPNWRVDSTKVAKMVEILEGETASHGYVIFCNFRDEMEILKERFQDMECVSKVFTYGGDTSGAARQKMLEDLEAEVEAHETAEEPKQTILLAQLQCGGTGLNLQFMDRIIFSTPWWTAATMDQAAARVVRIGQRNPVVIHHVTLQEELEKSLNIDKYMNERIEEKRNLCHEMLEAASHVA